MNGIHIKDDVVTMPIENYNMLLLNARKLHALEAAGVDNWEGYDIAMDEVAKEALEEVKNMEDPSRG